MGLFTIILLAAGLCFDSFAVSLSSGMAQCQCQRRQFFRFALILALFQGIMPLIGWCLAANLQSHIANWDHWIAFILLVFLGVKMIKEAKTEDGETPPCDPFNLKRACILGFATSIDALITGIALAMITLKIAEEASQLTNMLISAGIICMVTFISCVIGLFLGRTANKKLGERAELIGGVILLLIGIRILIEHLME